MARAWLSVGGCRKLLCPTLVGTGKLRSNATGQTLPGWT